MCLVVRKKILTTFKRNICIIKIEMAFIFDHKK